MDKATDFYSGIVPRLTYHFNKGKNMSKKKKQKKGLPKERNPFALHALQRKAGVMKHRNEKRMKDKLRKEIQEAISYPDWHH